MPTLCPTCGGKGVYQPPADNCQKCSGRGYTVRIDLGGYGQLVRGDERTTPCYTCNKTGKIAASPRPCLVCKGTGQVKIAPVARQCTQCSGRGTIGGPEKYPSGMSKRQIVCPGCNGTKTIFRNEYVADYE